MYLRSDFLKIIESEIDSYPSLSVLYRAGDPRAFMAIKAVAEMASMLSQQVELAGMESFEKSRDTTILADAALKGILPKATPSIVNINVENGSDTDQEIHSGRILIDPSGREYVVLDSIEIKSGATGTLLAEQKTTRTFTHDFEVSEPFARIEVPEPDSDKYISGLHVTDLDGRPFSYSYRYTNVGEGELVYHIETDQYRRMYIVFGYDGGGDGGGIGYQPLSKETFSITVSETYGDVSTKQGAPFIFDYATSEDESLLVMSMDSISTAGANPPNISTLRSLTSYPSTYDDNAVYHGEFDRLIRRHITGLSFLSVWNEQREEEVRGASVDNINTLFISSVSDGDGTNSNIDEIIRTADDSYKIRHVEPVDAPYGLTIRAEVARIYRIDTVKDQLRILMLGVYGKSSSVDHSGLSAPTIQQITSLIKSNILALQDVNSDFEVSLSVSSKVLPEHWHYLGADRLSITVVESNQSINMYGR